MLSPKSKFLSTAEPVDGELAATNGQTEPFSRVYPCQATDSVSVRGIHPCFESARWVGRCAAARRGELADTDLDESFELRRGFSIPAGRHEFGELILGYDSNRSGRLSMSSQINLGSFWTGTRRHGMLRVRWRLNERFAASAEYDREHIGLASGAFVDDVAQLRAEWSLSTRMFLNAFVQYNGARDTWSSNVRFNLLNRPLSDIYVVWNEQWGVSLPSRGLIVKYTHSVGFCGVPAPGAGGRLEGATLFHPYAFREGP